MSTFDQDFKKALAAARGNDHAYNTREMSTARSHVSALDKNSLTDRKEAREEFLTAMRDNPEIVGERIGWLIGGHYGYGEKLLGLQILESKRSNRAAQLTHLIAGLEWQCPQAMAIDAWKKLTSAQQKKLDAEVEKAIKSGERSLVEE